MLKITFLDLQFFALHCTIGNVGNKMAPALTLAFLFYMRKSFFYIVVTSIILPFTKDTQKSNIRIFLLLNNKLKIWYFILTLLDSWPTVQSSHSCTAKQVFSLSPSLSLPPHLSMQIIAMPSFFCQEGEGRRKVFSVSVVFWSTSLLVGDKNIK